MTSYQTSFGMNSHFKSLLAMTSTKHHLEWSHDLLWLLPNITWNEVM